MSVIPLAHGQRGFDPGHPANCAELLDFLVVRRTQFGSIVEVNRVIASHEVVLDIATTSDAALIGDLLELYTHDLSDVFPVQLGEDGRFGYQQLPLYWLEPERRYPFLI